MAAGPSLAKAMHASADVCLNVVFIPEILPNDGARLNRARGGGSLSPANAIEQGLRQLNRTPGAVKDAPPRIAPAGAVHDDSLPMPCAIRAPF
jgi:hypothetical protein